MADAIFQEHLPAFNRQIVEAGEQPVGMPTKQEYGRKS